MQRTAVHNEVMLAHHLSNDTMHNNVSPHVVAAHFHVHSQGIVVTPGETLLLLYSDTGTRTRVSSVKGKCDNHLHYTG